VLDKIIIRLVGDEARRKACEAIMAAPPGYIVQVAEPTRSSAQNALMWVLLTVFSKVLKWPVNGVLCRISKEDWKDLLTAAFRGEHQRVSPSLDGKGMVLLGMRTREFGKKAFIDFIDFVLATAAERGVAIEDSKAEKVRQRAANLDEYESQEAA